MRPELFSHIVWLVCICPKIYVRREKKVTLSDTKKSNDLITIEDERSKNEEDNNEMKTATSTAHETDGHHKAMRILCGQRKKGDEKWNKFEWFIVKIVIHLIAHMQRVQERKKTKINEKNRAVRIRFNELRIQNAHDKYRRLLLNASNTNQSHSK